MKELILGGVRSGKSRLAEQHALASKLEVIYIATATVGDAEMQQRIELHRQQRPSSWSLIEEPIKLATVLQQQAREDRCLLLDCLTLWLTNLLLNDDTTALMRERDALLEILSDLPGHIILVSNETGMGIVPESKLARRFGDEAGHLHQELAQRCDRVILTIAGLPQVLKGKI
ncbi:Adenosylcobinamide kinase / Adenosylcobinamide-phosphate guanylyltransferase [hydrothermal vent metagenome]|uniref:Adenosylcobinamide kinase n=1 Tax=hydrothermal vent metagenome TaxID=652676 RepID=A0A3B1B1A7_9ZZZZ